MIIDACTNNSTFSFSLRLKFPSILILYQLADTCIFLLVSLIGYMDTESLLCSSQDYTQRLVSSTAYCTSYGIIWPCTGIYTSLILILLAFLWLTYVSFGQLQCTVLLSQLALSSAYIIIHFNHLHE